MLATLAGKLNSNESFNPDRGFHVDVVFGPCQAQGRVIVKNTILDVCVWIEKTRKNDASFPSKTEMRYVALALSSPCERIVTKTRAPMGFANGTI